MVSLDLLAEHGTWPLIDYEGRLVFGCLFGDDPIDFL